MNLKAKDLNLKAKANDLSLKAKAKDFKMYPRGSSRTRTVLEDNKSAKDIVLDLS